MSTALAMKRGKAPSTDRDTASEASVRGRILAAAFAAFTERGFIAASTLDIATRAGVSKRELYSLFGSKQQILISCISGRARRMRLPDGLPRPLDREQLEAQLARFGTVLLSEVSEPEVVALYRLAVSEADRSPEVGRALELYGRGTAEAALCELLSGARAAGLLATADVEALASRFMSLLVSDLPLSLALGLRNRPGKLEIARQAAETAQTVLGLTCAPPTGEHTTRPR
jgi:AcrR family transcriptional regulator